MSSFSESSVVLDINSKYGLPASETTKGYRTRLLTVTMRTGHRQANKGDMAEAIVGAVWVASLTNCSMGPVTSEFIKQILYQMVGDKYEEESQVPAQKSRTFVTIYGSTVTFSLKLPVPHYNGLVDVVNGRSKVMDKLIKSAVVYGNAPQVKGQLDDLVARIVPEQFSVIAGGSSFQGKAKTDIQVKYLASNTWFLVPMGNITLKTDTKQISLVGRNYNINSPTSNSRGIACMLDKVLGTKLAENRHLAYEYDSLVLEQTKLKESSVDVDKAKIMKMSEKVYQTALSELETLPHSHILHTLATGVCFEVAGMSSDSIVQIRLKSNGTGYTHLDYGLLLEFATVAINTTDVVVTYEVVPYSSKSNPYLKVGLIVDGVDFQNLISVRPKLRVFPKTNDTGTSVKEWRHHLQNEPGLEKLILYVAQAHKNMGRWSDIMQR